MADEKQNICSRRDSNPRPLIIYLLGFEDARLNDEHAGDICFYYFHFQILLLHLYQTCLYIGYACGIRQFLVYGEDCIIISNQDLHAWKVARNHAMPENWLFDYWLQMTDWLFTPYLFSAVFIKLVPDWWLLTEYRWHQCCNSYHLKVLTVNA